MSSNIRLTDNHEITKTWHLNNNGFLVIDGFIARAGVQNYLAGELGDAFADRNPTDIIRMYRPADVVLADKAVKQYVSAPVTDDHPWEQAVDLENAGWEVKGHVTNDISVEGNLIKAKMIVHDKQLITDIMTDVKTQFSAGYDIKAEIESGFTDNNEPYDVRVTDLAINHVAVVKAARCGTECSVVNDNQTTGDDMVKITTGDSTVEVSNEVGQYVNDLKTENVSLQSKLSDKETEVGTLTGQVQTLNDKVSNLESQAMTPEKLDLLADERNQLINDASKILGDESKNFVFKGKDCRTIKEEVLKVVTNDSGLEGKTEGYISGYFKSLVDNASNESGNLNDLGTRLADEKAGGKSNVTVADARANSRQNYINSLTGKNEEQD